MANTEILLLEKIDKLGLEGDIVKVKAGFARNFLLPRKKAVPLNLSNKKRLDALMIARAARESEELQNAQEIATKLENISLAIAVKTGSGGKLFGSVTSQQIVDKLKEQGFVLNKRHFKNFNPIKDLGKMEVHLQLHQEVVVNLTVEVVSENPIEVA